MTNKYYNKLIMFQKKYPELTLNNNGYEYLNKEIQEKFKKQIKEISDILKIVIPEFVKFNNFKPRKDGSFSVRCQQHYDKTFKGVGYFHITDFKKFKEYDKKEIYNSALI
jgi:hypothetical protein